MQVETSRFGTIEVADDEVVTFPDGLPGFRRTHEMVLLGGGQLPGGLEGQGHHTLYWLQDVADPDLAFLTIVPWSAYPTTTSTSTRTRWTTPTPTTSACCRS